MRALVLASVMARASAAMAQPLPERPDTPAPAASAPIEQRQIWCQQYAAWVVSHTPSTGQAPEARPTHRLEVELNSCTPDPQAYERQTIAELARATEMT